MNTTGPLADALKGLADTFNRRAMRGFFYYAKENDLSLSQMGMLIRLSHGGPLGVMRIGGDMSMTGAAASQMVERLVQQGLVARSENPEDRRAHPITLTARGESAVRECKEWQYRWVESLAAGLEPGDAAPVTEALGILARQMQKLDEASVEAAGPCKKRRER
jgi:DNA-binding MarR family transcriptional regulator